MQGVGKGREYFSLTVFKGISKLGEVGAETYTWNPTGNSTVNHSAKSYI